MMNSQNGIYRQIVNVIDLVAALIREKSQSLAILNYIIDGHFLLHRVVWAKGKTFHKVAKTCVQYTANTLDLPVVLPSYRQQSQL